MRFETGKRKTSNKKVRVSRWGSEWPNEIARHLQKNLLLSGKVRALTQQNRIENKKMLFRASRNITGEGDTYTKSRINQN